MNTPKDSWLTKIFLALLGAILATTLTTGCATSLELTEEHLQAGRVDDALKLIEKVRSSDDVDPQAKSLEAKVRRQWIADKLIQVRLLRLGGNLESSASLLREVIQQETKWAMIPTGAVFATQAEETGHLADMILSAIREALRREQPLLATSRYLRDRELLESTLKVDTQGLRTAIGDSMSRFCAKEARTVSKYDHFHFQFLQKTCGHFKVTLPKTSTLNSVRLFSRMTPKFNLKGVPESSIAEIGKELAAEFERSIWFDRDSKTGRELEFALTGNVLEKIDERPVYRSKPFSVQIPFEERSVRKKEERSGIGLLFEVLAWALGAGLPSSHEIDNFDGTVTVIETKYRTETRYHTYQVNEVTQTLSLDWNVEIRNATGTNDGRLLSPYQFKDQHRLVSDEHGVRFPDASLFPESRKTLHPVEWLKTVNKKLIERVGRELNSAWIAKFCDFQKERPIEHPEKGLILSEFELHHRCVFGSLDQTPESSSGWFTKTYGVEIEAWRQVLAVPIYGK